MRLTCFSGTFLALAMLFELGLGIALGYIKWGMKK
jgi:hypothetical protein